MCGGGVGTVREEVRVGMCLCVRGGGGGVRSEGYGESAFVCVCAFVYVCLYVCVFVFLCVRFCVCSCISWMSACAFACSCMHLSVSQSKIWRAPSPPQRRVDAMQLCCTKGGVFAVLEDVGMRRRSSTCGLQLFNQNSVFSAVVL